MAAKASKSCDLMAPFCCPAVRGVRHWRQPGSLRPVWSSHGASLITIKAHAAGILHEPACCIATACELHLKERPPVMRCLDSRASDWVPCHVGSQEALGASERVISYLDAPAAPQIAPGKPLPAFSGQVLPTEPSRVTICFSSGALLCQILPLLRRAFSCPVKLTRGHHYWLKCPMCRRWSSRTSASGTRRARRS